MKQATDTNEYNQKDPWKTVAIRNSVHGKLKAIAKADRRAINSQLDFLVDTIYTRYKREGRL